MEPRRLSGAFSFDEGYFGLANYAINLCMPAETKGAAPPTTCACSSCGALYEVNVQHFSVKDTDHANCFVCKRVLAQWDSAYVPFFKLIRAPIAWTARASQ
jgi:hypothetical protein